MPCINQDLQQCLKCPLVWVAQVIKGLASRLLSRNGLESWSQERDFGVNKSGVVLHHVDVRAGSLEFECRRLCEIDAKLLVAQQAAIAGIGAQSS